MKQNFQNFDWTDVSAEELGLLVVALAGGARGLRLPDAEREHAE
jgi:hypothetical protein